MGKVYTRTAIIIIAYQVFFTGLVIAGNQVISYGQAYEYREPRLLNTLPELKGWYDAGTYLEERKDKATGTSRLYRVDAITGKESIFLDYPAWQPDFPEGFRADNYIAYSRNYENFLYDTDNDLYYYQPATNTFRRLTQSDEPEINATFSADGQKIAFTRQNDLYVVDIKSGKEKRLTFDAGEAVYNGYAAWVYYEEILGRRSKYKAFWWSPLSDRIAFMRFDESMVPEFPLFCADGVHGNLEMQRYPKAGDPVPEVRLGFVDVLSGQTVWADSGQVKNEYLGPPQWMPDGSGLIMQWKNRRQNHLKIFLADPVSGKSPVIYQEKHTGWIEFNDDITVAKGIEGFFFVSDQSGWPAILNISVINKKAKKITSDQVRVKKILQADAPQNTVYFEGWDTNSNETHLFSTGIAEMDVRRLTKDSGTHAITIAPGGKYYYDQHSNISQPDKIDLCTGAGQIIRTLGDQKSQTLENLTMGKTELFAIPASDGVELPAMWILPPDFDPAKRYPVLFSVYGGPERSSVRNEFQRISNFYLAQYGLIIINVDHRGSGHFGKEGADKMYRNLGKYELDDLIEAVKWLRGKSFIDSTRIAITGASYGGYVACLALTRGAEYFTHGIAYYSVTDWKLYDAIYTERYMDLPLNNPEGYEFGSVLNYAGDYNGKLLLIHGSMDDNVHAQNSVQLVDKLTEFDQDFEFVLIPDSRHGTSRSKRKFMRMKYLEYVFENLLEKKWPGWDD